MIPKHNMWDGLPNAFKVKKRWGKTLREVPLAKDLKQGGQSPDLHGWGDNLGEYVGWIKEEQGRVNQKSFMDSIFLEATRRRCRAR
jgi:hypothetical protein